MIRNSVSDWQELSALYEEADALDGTGLDRLLKRLEADANPLLAPLRRMLDARSRIAEDDFLSRLPSLPEAGSIEQSQWRPGAGIGPYRLLRHLGSGGMAEVWLAERADGSFERTVAIKLLFDHPSQAQRHSFVERFRRERDILAALDHPRIARLHDAGVTPSGQPWLALEAVEGEPITAWCDRERLGLAARVRLFREVLDAVEHAHARLVIHRDIKPSNVLVGRDGTVRLLDFGISKLIEVPGQAQADTALTQHGGRPLTPEYASPEQLRGDPLTTACDIYSLGVLLHELLVGARPRVQRDASTGDEDIGRPSRYRASPHVLTARRTDTPALARALRPDLDAILLKALDPQAARRYESVGALRADLDRWLRYEPVLATAPGRLYRLRKFARRHRVALGVSSVVATVLAVAVGATLWQGTRARQESARALVAKQFLLDMFRLSDPNMSERGNATTSAMLDAGIERADASLSAEPALHGDVLRGIAEIEQHLGRYVLADSILRRAEAIYVGIGEPRALAVVRIDLTDNALRLGRLDQASDRLAAVAPDLKRFADDHDLQARGEEAAAWLARARGDSVGARAHMRAQLEHALAAFGAHDARVVDAWRGLAMLDSDSGRHEAAMKNIAAAEAAASGSSNLYVSDRVAVEVETALVALNAGWYVQAQTRILQARDHCDAMLGAANEDCVYARQLEAFSLLQMGKARDALELLSVFEADAENDQSPTRRDDAVVMVARILCANGSLETRSSIEARLKRIAHPSSHETHSLSELPARLLLAEAALRQGRADDARQEIAEMLAATAARTSPTWRARALLLDGLALQILQRHREALATMEEAAGLLVEASGASHPNAVLARVYEVPSLIALGDRKRAAILADRARETLEARLPSDAPLLQRVSTVSAELRQTANSPLRAARRAVFFHERPICTIPTPNCPTS